MPYTFLDDLTLSDEAFRATGESLDELFTSSWLAVLHLLIGNPESLEPRSTEILELESSSIDLLLFDFLEGQLYIKDTTNLFLKPYSVAVSAQGETYCLAAEMRGEEFDPARHVAGTEVKAITMYQFNVTKQDDVWIATVVVDV